VAAEEGRERAKFVGCEHSACGLFARCDGSRQSTFHQLSGLDWTLHGIATGMKSVNNGAYVVA
jgi:hypothetical protein